jgi:hypothetical protein
MNPTLCSLPTLPPLTFELTHTLYTLERISASSSSVAEIEPELVRPQRHGRDRHLSPTLLSVFFYLSGDPSTHPSSSLCLGSTRRSSSLELRSCGRGIRRRPREQLGARLRVHGARTRPPRAPLCLCNLASIPDLPEVSSRSSSVTLLRPRRSFPIVSVECREQASCMTS